MTHILFDKHNPGPDFGSEPESFLPHLLKEGDCFEIDPEHRRNRSVVILDMENRCSVPFRTVVWQKYVQVEMFRFKPIDNQIPFFEAL